MYLKQLVLKGFKSFADRSVLSLEPGITAVVGPNGSGKSNISDAVLWVLGERNAKNLRGQVMEDVIFAGSSARKSVGVAEVSLVLDNSDGSLPVDYDEVTISRRMFRNGESEYLINGTVVRRLDVLDILHDSGLGTGTHSIISQGHLDSILQSKPEDRRALIEEAAGVLKHKQRKAKSQRKIEQMDQHLARVNDVVKELDRQLGPLQRKAKRAMQYQEVSAKLKDVRLQLAVDDLRLLQKQWGQLLESESQLQAAIGAKKDAVSQAERAYEAIQESIRRDSVDLSLLAQKQSKATSLVDRFDSLSLLLGEKQRQAEQRCSELNALLEQNTVKRQEAQADREVLAAELAKVQAERSAAQQELDEAQVAYGACHGRRLDIEREVGNLHRRRGDAEREVERNRKELSRTQEQLASSMGRAQAAKERAAEIDARVAAATQGYERTKLQAVQSQQDLSGLEAKEKELSALMEQARASAESLRRQAEELRRKVSGLEAELRGIQEVERAMMAAAGPAHAWVASRGQSEWGTTPLYDHVRVAEGYEKTVERLLGNDVTALLVQDSSRVRAIGQALAQSGKAGRVTLMLNASVPSAKAPASGQRLLDKITCDDDIRQNIETLLGDVVLCQTLDEALAAHDKDRLGLRFVTPEGCVVFPSGKILLGTESQEKGEGALERNKRFERVSLDLQDARNRYEDINSQVAKAEEESKLATEVSLQVRQELATAVGKAQAAKREEQSALQALQKIQSEREQSERQAQAAQDAVAAAQPLVEQLQQRALELEKSVEDAKDQIRQKQQELSPIRDQEQQLSQRWSDAKLSSATLTERETYLARSVDVRAKELLALSAADEGALQDLFRKQAARKRIDPLRDVIQALRDGAQEKAHQVALQARSAQEANLGAHAQASQAREVSRLAHQEFDKVSEDMNQLQVDKGRLELRVQAAADSIVRDCDTPMETALALPVLEDRALVEESAFKLEKRIANMGAINPDAAEEYEQLKERYDYLQAQLADLASARSALKKIDRVIDERMKDDFANTFETVNGYFKEIFEVLFPGGTAELSLVDPSNMETTGVEVHAQPKGKRIAKMTLMSGGEKSLVACALLFAVYRTRSTPFYILDEIEAALDDSNLRRLTSYLRSLSSQTQLIMITHQRRTMEMADVLFGVSMQADGVTKVISQRLEKALQYAE